MMTFIIHVIVCLFGVFVLCVCLFGVFLLFCFVLYVCLFGVFVCLFVCLFGSTISNEWCYWAVYVNLP